jgi:hypothetical protein
LHLTSAPAKPLIELESAIGAKFLVSARSKVAIKGGQELVPALRFEEALGH